MKNATLFVTATLCFMLSACSGDKSQDQQLAIESFGRPQIGQNAQTQPPVIDAVQPVPAAQAAETTMVVQTPPVAPKQITSPKVKPVIKKTPPVKKTESATAVQSNPVNTPQAPQEQFGKPRTREEARDRSYGLYIAARRALSAGAVDSALALITKSLEMYENGATYALKARALTQAGDYGAARVAAERSEGKSDHWQPENRTTARQEKIMAMQKMYEHKPSSILKGEIENATQF